MAPELFDPDPAYGTEVDVWAFGSMVYEVASGLPPNVSAAAVDIATFGSRLRQQCPRLEGERYSSQLRDLVAFCLVEDPKKRPSIADIQQHPYLFGTADRFPTESLAQLVKAYRLWEAQGGVRKSLFVPGGAAHPDEEAEPRASTGSRDGDEWSFDTASFEDDFADADIQAVYDAYGYTVEFAPETLRAAPHRRGPPPSRTGPPLRGPLEKVFDPNTLSGYDENSRAFYGLATPEAVRTTSTSDLPLRSSTQDADLRESLIDLDMSLDGSRLSRFADTGTQYVAAGGSETMLSLDPRPLPKENAPSPPPKPDSNRRTQDWTFPVMSPSPPKPSSLQKTGLQAVGTASYSRLSAVSLIDLDAGNPGPRPSTAHSNSSSSVDSGSFDLDGNSIFGRRLPVSCSTRLPPPGATIPRKPLAQRRPVKEEEEDEEQQQQPRTLLAGGGARRVAASRGEHGRAPAFCRRRD
ncbi:hypothetical protein VTK73DRAFT_9783 [Phialemonium thermophilum]|uniref:Protein kinase domain-containing protein n=1 Tax=Phialemonium thermophilum TaxID=223376 RepID=A0ABR3W0E6_9PEZI